MKYKDYILLKAITTLFYKTPYTPFGGRVVVEERTVTWFLELK